jgi:hypothetical protein
LDRSDPSGLGPDFFGYSTADLNPMAVMARVNSAQDAGKAEAGKYENWQIVLRGGATISGVAALSPAAPVGGPISVVLTVIAVADTLSIQRSRLVAGRCLGGCARAKEMTVNTATIGVSSMKDLKQRTTAAFQGKKQGARISFASENLLWKALTHQALGIAQSDGGARLYGDP